MIARVFLVSAVMFALGAPAWADDPKDASTVKGQIFAVNEKEMVVMADKEQITFVVGPATKISLDGSPVKLRDLKPGQSVQVASREEAGQKVALSIDAKGMTGQPMPPVPKRT
jgi:hypothetical protein